MCAQCQSGRLSVRINYCIRPTLWSAAFLSATSALPYPSPLTPFPFSWLSVWRTSPHTHGETGGVFFVVSPLARSFCLLRFTNFIRPLFFRTHWCQWMSVCSSSSFFAHYRQLVSGIGEGEWPWINNRVRRAICNLTLSLSAVGLSGLLFMAWLPRCPCRFCSLKHHCQVIRVSGAEWRLCLVVSSGPTTG